jgi:hypothetical protein
MKIPELSNAPQWLMRAIVANEDVEIDDNGRVVWLGGDWLDGDWHDGVWHDGVWHGGVWHDGDWRDGLWRGGVWYGGVWRGERIDRPLASLHNLRWPVYVSPTRIMIGCELHTHRTNGSPGVALLADVQAGRDGACGR